ncbi:MAG: MFS transporter [Anaerolineaceae bacterium]|nr:MAG: MFS transporter [Anaerolineaceae bacterium]
METEDVISRGRQTKGKHERLSGMSGFTIVWVGQVISFLGSGMTWFALTIWAWEITGQATALALVGFFAFGPTVLLSPIAGALVDRWNRKLVMMLSDLAAGLSTVVILILYASGNLEIWHLYVTGAFAGAFQAFQFPAYSAAVTMMLPKEQYARASGMLSLADSASGVLAPIMAGVLLGPIGITGIMAIDVITFIVAIGALLIVHVPQPATTEAGEEGRGSLLKESAYGFRYIYQRKGLFSLLLIFLAANLIFSISYTVLSPMILARTANDEVVLGTVRSVMGLGGVAGGLLLSAWGGPKRKIHGVLLGMAVSSIAGTVVLGMGKDLAIWALGAFLSTFFMPIINGSSQAIWQAKVAPDVQGRVFSVRRLIAQVSAPLAILLSGPLADHVFEPAMMAGGSLVHSFGSLVGIGSGAGMSLMFVLTGFFGVFVSLVGYLFPEIRDVEAILPDHEAVAVSP